MKEIKLNNAWLFLTLCLTTAMYNSCNKSNSYSEEKSISVTDSSAVDCLSDFDFLVEIIKTDYPGYNDKVKDENRSQLMDLEKVIRQKIANPIFLF